MMRAALWLASACLALAPLAGAAPPPGSATGPCAEDAQRLCADSDRGHGAIMRCLQQHQADLSEECRARIAAVKEKMHEHAAALHAACGSDAERLCPGLEAGTGLVKCLYDHEQDIPQACRDAMRELGPEN